MLLFIQIETRYLSICKQYIIFRLHKYLPILLLIYIDTHYLVFLFQIKKKIKSFHQIILRPRKEKNTSSFDIRPIYFVSQPLYYPDVDYFLRSSCSPSTGSFSKRWRSFRVGEGRNGRKSI